MDYDNENAIFKGYVYTLNTPQYNLANRSQYVKGTDFKQDNVENTSNNCYTLGVAIVL